jgi:hypothetical protein
MLEYMKFDKDSLRDIINVIIGTEDKVDADLRLMGFKIKTKIEIPEYYKSYMKKET